MHLTVLSTTILKIVLWGTTSFLSWYISSLLCLREASISALLYMSRTPAWHMMCVGRRTQEFFPPLPPLQWQSYTNNCLLSSYKRTTEVIHDYHIERSIGELLIQQKSLKNIIIWLNCLNVRPSFITKIRIIQNKI